MAARTDSGQKGKATGTASPRTRTRETHSKDGAAAQGLRLHTAHPSIPVPYLTREDLSANAKAAEFALPNVKVPSPERLAFYGGLGILAVAGAVEWPVAAAIGVATVVARRGREAGKRG